mmetsp:Transcript_26914/g.41027  ORF Transcript_26914/g.41027 Transcript_26914/m.41027 type:complete len:85 (+) Transcript_26914:2777-3031(+)
MDPSAPQSQHSKRLLRVGYMNETFGKNIINPKFLCNYLEATVVSLKLFSNEHISERMTKLMKEITIRKLKKLQYKEQNHRYTIS